MSCSALLSTWYFFLWCPIFLGLSALFVNHPRSPQRKAQVAEELNAYPLVGENGQVMEKASRRLLTLSVAVYPF
jgi:hypothetical protein